MIYKPTITPDELEHLPVAEFDGEIVVVSRNGSRDRALGRDKSAELIGVYGQTARPEWIAEDLLWGQA
jgi:hypothetical protein